MWTHSQLQRPHTRKRSAHHRKPRSRVLKAEPYSPGGGLTFCNEGPRPSETEPHPSEWNGHVEESEPPVRSLEWQRCEPGRSPALAGPQGPETELYTANPEA